MRPLLTPRELLHLNVLNVRAWTYSRLLVHARERGDGIAARRLDGKLKACCLELAPLLRRWEDEGRPPIPHTEEEPQ